MFAPKKLSMKLVSMAESDLELPRFVGKYVNGMPRHPFVAPELVSRMQFSRAKKQRK